jgi:hypothetical protein
LTLIPLTPQAIEKLCFINQEINERGGALLRFNRHSRKPS